MAAKTTSKTAAGIDSLTPEALQKGVERTVEFNREYFEAIVQSVTTAAKGLETLGNENLAFAKHTMEEGVKAAKAIMAVKSVQDFVSLQSEYSRSAFDQFVNQAAKINDLSQTITKDAYAPVNGRAVAFYEEIRKARAV